MEVARALAYGVIAGSGFALIGMGISLIFRASRVLNLGQAAMGFAAALGYIGFTSLLPSWPGWAVLALATVVAFGFGFLLYLQTFRLLEGASMLGRILVTAAVGAGILTTITWIRGQQLDLQIEPAFAGSAFSLAGITVTANQLATVVLAALAAGGIVALLRWTLFGITLRAISDNREIAAATGVNTHLVAGAAWGLGIACAAVGAIMALAETYVAFDVVPNLQLKALAAALVGGFVSPAAAWAGGLLIGVAESVLLLAPPGISGLSGEFAFWLVVALLIVGVDRWFAGGPGLRAAEA